MTYSIVRATPDLAPALGRICYEAFGTLHERHQVPRDFADEAMACMVLGMLCSRPDFAGFVAMQDGSPIGSNFISFTDEVAGVGPITVDPACQAKGVGRALMRAVLDEAASRSVRHVRLMQEAVNTTSLSLYTSLGFDWREAVAVMTLEPADGPPPEGVRAMTQGDLDAAHRLSEHHYHHSRRNEVAAALHAGLPVLVRERAARPGARGDLSAYLIPGFFGHGFAATHEDMLALMDAAARTAPPPFRKLLLPLGQVDLFRAMLARGCRTLKVMNFMTVGPYTPPRESWIPSIGN
jgi:GNAT superfamily N-acetyltransferase